MSAIDQEKQTTQGKQNSILARAGSTVSSGSDYE